MNWLPHSPLASRRFCVIKMTLLRNLLHHINVILRGKELNIREVSMEEIINLTFDPPPTQDPISLPNQNQTLELVPLWGICVYLVNGPAGVDVT